MKKDYVKPELGTKQYAQFENVYTAGCNKNKLAEGCRYDGDPTYPSTGSSYSSHHNLIGLS